MPYLGVDVLNPITRSCQLKQDIVYFWNYRNFLFCLTWEIYSPVQTQRMDSETCGVLWKWDFNGDLARSGAWQGDIRRGCTKHYIV
jgi:hypothetical protein